MHYNILYYGANTGFCNQSNNDISKKNEALKTIFAYVKPDIITLNEVSPNEKMRDSLLNNALNTNGIGYYRKTPSSNMAGSSISNAVFYNGRKVAYYNMQVIETDIRDINVYTFYHLNKSLENGDTLFFNCIVGHLKSSNTASDREKRTEMLRLVVQWLQKQSNTDNYLIMGDFNLYNSDEECYQLITKQIEEKIRFYDPIEQSGNWHDNEQFAKYHTQSTHIEGSCHSTGGLDDRFDFILIDNDLKSGNKKMEYIQNSYLSVGNDGKHLNQSIIDSLTSTDETTLALLQALYLVSDHLPVCLSLKVEASTLSANQLSKTNIFTDLIVENPIKNFLDFSIESTKKQNFTLCILDKNGQSLYSRRLSAVAGRNNYSIPLKNRFSTGVYLLNLSVSERIVLSKKIIIAQE